MKQRRYTWWRILLTLLLGGSVWWFISWWLTPRPWFTTEIDLASWPRPEGRISGSFLAFNRLSGTHLIDEAGRYLLLKEVSSEINYRVVDLQSRQVVAVHTINEALLVDHFRLGMIQQQLNINHFFMVTSKRAVDSSEAEGRGADDRPFQYSLWEWNVLTGATRLIRKYPISTTVRLSQNGTTLLEVERRPILSPSLFMPPSLTNVLAGQAVASLHLEDLAIYRVYSLPARELRCTLIKPWIYRQGRGELSPRGEYLIFDDVVLPFCFTSPLKITPGEQRPESSLREIVTYATVPHGISIYRTRDGSLLAERQEPDLYLQFAALGDEQTLLFLPLGSADRQERKDQVFHAPSQRWLDKPVYFAIPLSQGQLHASGETRDNRSTAYAIDLQGMVSAVGTIIGDEPFLLPGVPHYIRRREYKPLSAIPLPASWEEWLRQSPMFEKWFRTYTQLEVVDYTSQRVLLKLRGIDTSFLQYRFSDRWLVCWSENLQTMRVEVYALPIRAWSVWWARSAGLIVLLLAWWGLCRPRVSNAQVLAGRTVTK